MIPASYYVYVTCKPMALLGIQAVDESLVWPSSDCVARATSHGKIEKLTRVVLFHAIFKYRVKTSRSFFIERISYAADYSLSFQRTVRLPKN